MVSMRSLMFVCDGAVLHHIILWFAVMCSVLRVDRQAKFCVMSICSLTFRGHVMFPIWYACFV